MNIWVDKDLNSPASRCRAVFRRYKKRRAILQLTTARHKTRSSAETFSSLPSYEISETHRLERSREALLPSLCSSARRYIGLEIRTIARVEEKHLSRGNGCSRPMPRSKNIR